MIRPRPIHGPFGPMALVTLLGWLAGCGSEPPRDSLVVTQVPAPAARPQPGDVLDARYPDGTRVILVAPPFGPGDVRILSKGLVAAGGPVISPDARRVFFVGKAQRNDAWQIYQAALSGRSPKRMTFLPGGAMDPVVLADGDLAFSSPVPKTGAPWTQTPAPALFAQSPGKAPRQLTFGGRAAIEPTVLADGRLLFVGMRAAELPANAAPRFGLFTINTDGTELTNFAVDGDGAPLVRRPRQLSPRLVGFLSGAFGAGEHLQFETVRMARPFASRTPHPAVTKASCTSVEWSGDDAVLLCLGGTASQPGAAGSGAVYRLALHESAAPELVYDDPGWEEVEAMTLAIRTPPMGHMSTVSPQKTTGTILCLNADFGRGPQSVAAKRPGADRVRVTAAGTNGLARVLGIVPLQADGSFLAEVPADLPLGFETLNPQGEVLQRLPPSLWVRPGENRSCIGCHEPANRSPRNRRPIAVTLPPVILPLTNQLLASGPAELGRARPSSGHESPIPRAAASP